VRESDGEVVDVGLGRAVDAEEGSGNAARERRQVDDRALAAVDRRKKKVRLGAFQLGSRLPGQRRMAEWRTFGPSEAAQCG